MISYRYKYLNKFKLQEGFMRYKLFLSHSSQDIKIVDAFVNFMYKIGLSEKDIICTSVASTKIPIKEDIYEYLNTMLSEERIFVIFFLSDNYYSSAVCLNEMGAAWLRKSDSLSILLPGFDFSDIQGVVNKNKIGIKLGTCDDMTKASFNEFKSILEDMFDIEISYTRWEMARDEFLNMSIENVRKFDMAFSRSYCIGDLENDGCVIVKKDSNRNIIKAMVDFNETESKLSSIVVFNGKRDFTSYFINKKNLCFEAYADEGITCADIELRLGDIDMSYEILLNTDERSYKIPLVQFCDELSFWRNVSEIKFVLHRKKVTQRSNIVIKNLRIE
jgi:hypothetical protein